ncbi:hypothetical protein PG996_003776 [Apiospora saccharicola]|uniref:Uncharacterized protein n=1 Tax=Apiospora saccharicola TaxID=335842 RepID=A0ABR1W299_9PEZI
MAQPNAHTGHLAIYSPDLRLNHASLAPYADLLCRRQSPFVAATLTRTRDIVERLLVVLFGLLRGYRRHTEIHWLWSAVTRQWLQLNVTTSTETSRVKRLIQVVLQARRLKKSRMVIQVVAQTHLGRLVDTWDAHLRGFYTRPIGSNPTPDRQMVNSWRQIQAIVDGNIRSVPHIIFGINQPLGNNQPAFTVMPPTAPITSTSTSQATAAATATSSTAITQPVSIAPTAVAASTGAAPTIATAVPTGNNQVTTAIDPNAAAQSAAEAATGTTQSAAPAAADATAGSAQSSVPSIATATSTVTIRSDDLATATTASAASGSSINSGSEADDAIEMPLPTSVATETDPEPNSASGSVSATGSVSGSASTTVVDATASGSISPTASSTDEMERALAEKQQSQG